MLPVRAGSALLAGTSRSLSEIACACGFSSQAHMTTTFSRRLGMPPGAYRKLASR